MTAVAFQGSPPYTFSWSPSTGLSSTTGASVTASPTSNTVYTVTATDSLGAQATANTTVAFDAPSVTISGVPSGAILSGTLVSLTAIAGGGSPFTFAWTEDGVFIATTAGVMNTPTLGDHTYAVNMTDAFGCTANASAMVHVFDYSLSLVPTSQTVALNGSASYAVIVNLANGSTSSSLPMATLSVAGLPGSVTSNLPASVNLGSSFTLTLQASGTPVGDYVFTISASVPGGSSPRTATGHFVVSFAICVLYDQTQVKKLGSTVPIKLEICDANGNDASSPNIVVHAVALQLQSSSVPPVTPDDSGNANPDNDFRFDSTLGTSGGYIFNLRTNGLAAGTWSLIFTVDNDPTMHTVLLVLR